MAKSADAFRSIGEVARLIGVAPHVLRYWETQFPQLAPVKRADGRRYYRPDDVRLAAGLCEVMRDDGMTARGALRLMAEDRGAALRARGAERVQVLLEAEAGGGGAAPKASAVRRKVAAKPADMPLFGDGLEKTGPAASRTASTGGPGVADHPVGTGRPVNAEPAAAPRVAANPHSAQPTPGRPTPVQTSELANGRTGTILARLAALTERVSAVPPGARPDLRTCTDALRALIRRTG